MSRYDQNEDDTGQPNPARPSRARRTPRTLKLTPPRSYEVGYGKPPVEHRFTKGRSGNPSGRPKGARNKPKPSGFYEERLPEMILNEAHRTVTLRDGERSRTVTMAEAVLRAIAVNAAKGHARAQRLFTDLLARAEAAQRARSEDELRTLLLYKLDWEHELARRKALNITHLPDPLPHPDDILIDPRAGTAIILGPMTADEKTQWDKFAQGKAELEAQLDALRERLRRTRHPERRNELQARILEYVEMVEPLRELFPHRDNQG